MTLNYNKDYTTNNDTPLFTLGSIYNTNANGTEQMPETKNSNWS